MNRTSFEKIIAWSKRPTLDQIKNIKDVQRIKSIYFENRLKR